MDTPLSTIRNVPAIPVTVVNNASSSSSSNIKTLMAHEIEKWTAMASKTKTSKKILEEEAEVFLVANTMSKLRDLQKEIRETDWMYDISYK